MIVFKTAFVIIGAIIGAGFASGKEIFEYFAKFGIYSLLFVIPLFVFFYFFIYTYLKFGENHANFDLKKFSSSIGKNYKLFNVSFNIYNVGLFFTFLVLCSAMFSGLVSLFSTYLPSGHKLLYFLASLVITVVLVKTSFKSFKLLSNLVVPLIVLFVIINVVCSLGSGNFCTDFGFSNILPLPFLTIAYASQNTFFSSFVIIKLGSNLNKKQRAQTSFLTSLVICLLITLGILCFLFNPKLAYCDMPFVEVAISINPVFSVLFATIIFGSIITTHATCLTSLKEFFKGEKKYNNTTVMIALIILLSLLNFGKIVQYLYPLIGVFGLIYFYKICNYDKSQKMLVVPKFVENKREK